MVIEGLLDSNQHKNKCCCATEKSTEVYRCKLNSALEKNSPNFAWYGKIPEFMNSEHLDVKSTQSPHLLKGYMTGQKKRHSRVT